MKLRLCVGSLVAFTATILIAGSASASSTGSLEDFFASLFGKDKSGGRQTATAPMPTLAIGDDTVFSAAVMDGVSVIPDTTYAPPVVEEEETVAANNPAPILGGHYPQPVLGNGNGAKPVPEPSAALLFGLGSLVIARRVRR